MGLKGKFEVLGDPGYRRLFLGRTVSLIGDGITPVALAFAVLDLTGSATDLGIVLAANTAVLICLVLVGGVFADRISPRLAMLGSDLLRLVSTGLIAALLIAGVAEIWEIVVLYALGGVGTAFFNPASNALVPQIVPADRLQEANALLNFSRWSGKVAGPALAGVLLALGSPGAALAVDAATFGVSALCLLGIRAPGLRDPDVEPSFLGELRHGWSEFRSLTWLWAIVLSASISNGIFYPGFQVLGPTVAKASLGGSSAWALIASFWGVGGVIGGALALGLRPRRPLLLSETVVVCIALPCALLAIPASTAVIALGSLLAGVTVSLAEILFDTASAQHIPGEAMARVVAYDWLGSLALEPLGLALVGPLAAGIGISETLWIGAAVMFVCQAAVLLVPSVRRLEWKVPPAGTPVPPRPIEAGN